MDPRTERMLKSVSPSLQNPLKEILGISQQLRKLGYVIFVSKSGNIKLAWEGMDLGLELRLRDVGFYSDYLHATNGSLPKSNELLEIYYQLMDLLRGWSPPKNAKDAFLLCKRVRPLFKQMSDLAESIPEVSSERTASYRLRKLARKFSTERYLQAPSEGKEYLRDHAKRIKVMVREMAEQMTPETREKLQIGNPKPLGAGLNGFVFAGSEPGVVVKAAFNLNDAIMAERVMKMEKGLECLPRVYKVLKHVRLYDGAIGCHLIYLERLRPLPVKVAKALETMLDGVMHDDNFQVKRFSPAMYMRALQKVVERAPKGSVMSWTAMQLQVILKELASQKWWHIDLHSENFCLSADGKRLKMIDLGALMDPEEVAHMWGPIAFPQEHTAQVRTAVSDAERTERLVQRTHEPELLWELLKVERKINALGFLIQVEPSRGDIVLAYKGTSLALRLYMAKAGIDGVFKTLDSRTREKMKYEEFDRAAEGVTYDAKSILAFLSAHRADFKRFATILYDKGLLNEVSSEEHRR